MKRVVLLAATTFCILSTSSFASAGEVMTDRCSAGVAIVPSYDAAPNTPGTLLLTRNSSGSTPWSQPVRVQLGSRGHVRWWCNSTAGNLFDPGTWRPDLDRGKTAVCVAGGVAYVLGVQPAAAALSQCQGAVRKIDSSAWNGWTPERSRCDDRSTLVRARLGSNRLLQIECLGR